MALLARAKTGRGQYIDARALRMRLQLHGAVDPRVRKARARREPLPARACPTARRTTCIRPATGNSSTSRRWAMPCSAAWRRPWASPNCAEIPALRDGGRALAHHERHGRHSSRAGPSAHPLAALERCSKRPACRRRASSRWPTSSGDPHYQARRSIVAGAGRGPGHAWPWPHVVPRLSGNTRRASAHAGRRIGQDTRARAGANCWAFRRGLDRLDALARFSAEGVSSSRRIGCAGGRSVSECRRSRRAGTDDLSHGCSRNDQRGRRMPFEELLIDTSSGARRRWRWAGPEKLARRTAAGLLNARERIDYLWTRARSSSRGCSRRRPTAPSRPRQARQPTARSPASARSTAASRAIVANDFTVMGASSARHQRPQDRPHEARRHAARPADRVSRRILGRADARSHGLARHGHAARQRSARSTGGMRETPWASADARALATARRRGTRCCRISA